MKKIDGNQNETAREEEATCHAFLFASCCLALASSACVRGVVQKNARAMFSLFFRLLLCLCCCWAACTHVQCVLSHSSLSVSPKFSSSARDLTYFHEHSPLQVSPKFWFCSPLAQSSIRSSLSSPGKKNSGLRRKRSILHCDSSAACVQGTASGAAAARLSSSSSSGVPLFYSKAGTLLASVKGYLSSAYSPFFFPASSSSSVSFCVSPRSPRSCLLKPDSCGTPIAVVGTRVNRVVSFSPFLCSPHFFCYAIPLFSPLRRRCATAGALLTKTSRFVSSSFSSCPSLQHTFSSRFLSFLALSRDFFHVSPATVGRQSTCQSSAVFAHRKQLKGAKKWNVRRPRKTRPSQINPKPPPFYPNVLSFANAPPEYLLAPTPAGEALLRRLSIARLLQQLLLLPRQYKRGTAPPLPGLHNESQQRDHQHLSSSADAPAFSTLPSILRDRNGDPLVNAAAAGPQTAAAAEIQALSKDPALLADLEEMKAVALREDDHALRQLHEHLALATAPVRWPQQKQQDQQEEEVNEKKECFVSETDEGRDNKHGTCYSNHSGTALPSRQQQRRQELRVSFRRLLHKVCAAVPFIRYNRVLLLECCIDPWWSLWQQRRLNGLVAKKLQQVKRIARRLQKNGVSPASLLKRDAFENFRLLEDLPRSSFVKNYFLRHSSLCEDAALLRSPPPLPSSSAACPAAAAASATTTTTAGAAAKQLPPAITDSAAPKAAATAAAGGAWAKGAAEKKGIAQAGKRAANAEGTDTAADEEQRKLSVSRQLTQRHAVDKCAVWDELQACGVVGGKGGKEVNIEALKELFGSGHAVSVHSNKDASEARAERERRRSLPKDRIGRQELHQQRNFREAAVGKALPRAAVENWRGPQQQNLSDELLSAEAEKRARLSRAFDALLTADFPEYKPLTDIYQLETFVEAEYRLHTIKREVQQQLRNWIEEGMPDEPEKPGKNEFLVYWMSLSRRQRKQMLREESPTNRLSTAERLRRIRSRFIAGSVLTTARAASTTG